MRSRCFAACFWFFALLAACRGGSGAKPRVVVTTFAVFDLARRIAGPDADVVLLAPPGKRLEDFRPTPETEQQVTGAGLGVLIGSDLDAWLVPMMKKAAEKGRILKLADRVPPLLRPLPGEGGTGEVRVPLDENGPIDVHIWLDPQRALLIARAVTDQLGRLDAAHAGGYRTRSLAVTQALEALDKELEARTSAWKARSFAADHDDFRYYAQRYHLEARGAGASTGAGPQAQGIALDSVGGTAGVDSYEALLRHDTDALEKALAGSAPNLPDH